MKRMLILLALTGALVAAGCGGDDDEKEQGPDDGATGSKADAGRDAATGALADASVSRGVQVENVGATCTTNQQCTGPTATCQTEFAGTGTPTELKGGYCTAECKASAECGTAGACPLTEVTGGFQLPGLDITALIPSYCLDKCDKAASDCRSGYECKSIGDLVPEQIRPLAAVFLTGSGFTQPYCMPPITIALPAFDGGLPLPRGDAGPAISLTGGLDAGR